MGKIEVMQTEAPLPVKFFVGALFSDVARLEQSFVLLEKSFSPIDLQSKDFPFDVTDYYISEMGAPIQRRIVSFERLHNPIDLFEAKLACNAIENSLAVDGKRHVNLDIGYMDYDKVVLASAKYGIHKVYLGSGIYADMALHYEKGRYIPYPWAFMDFKLDRYHATFLKIRGIYKKQLKALRQTETGSAA